MARRRGNAAPVGSTRQTRGAMRDPEDEKPDVNMDLEHDIEGEEVEGFTAARRGAPPLSDPHIPTERAPDSSEFDAENGAELPPAPMSAQAPEADMMTVEEDEDETKLAILADGLPDIHQAAERLYRKQRDPDTNNPQYSVIMRRRRNAFISIRAEYESSHMAPYVDLKRLQRLDAQTGGQGAASIILRKANIASAIDALDQLRDSDFGTEKARRFFTSLKVAFPHSFAAVQTYSPDMQLRTYSQYLIETLASDDYNGDTMVAVAQTFCAVPPEAVSESNCAELLENGPFVALGGRNPGVETSMVTTRISKIAEWIKNHSAPKRAAVAIRRKDETRVFLTDLKNFLMKDWPTQTPRLAGEESQDPWGAMSAHDFGDTQSVFSMAESQPVMRPEGHSFAAPLYDRSPAQQAAAESLARVREAEASGAGFEDTRKRPAAPMAPMQRQPAKRSRIDTNPTSAYPMPPDPADGMMSSPRPTHPPPYATQIGTGTPIQGADYDAVKNRKKQISDAMRAERAQHPTQQSRKPWSQGDQDILLRCIYERQCRWAHIQEHDSDKFEVKRNQQAYRDKARNMKVDFLMTDAVLPPCFDGVALGKKEINRLIQLGKNPYRKEGDLNENNEPINIAYTPEHESGLLRRQESEQDREQEQQLRDDLAVREQLDIQQQQQQQMGGAHRPEGDERAVMEEERQDQGPMEAQ